MTPVPLNAEAVGLTSDPVRRRWDRDTTMLYAVGVGCGPDDGLSYAAEVGESAPLQALPTLAIVLSSPLPMFDGRPVLHLWDALGAIDWGKVVHGEQSLQMHRPLPVSGEILSTTTVTGVYDKGSGAVVVLETVSRDAADGEPLFTAGTSIYVRGAGGWGGDRGPRTAAASVPSQNPDHVVTFRTAANQALIYRLSGDRNPLHCDLDAARAAGFPRPILHGLCTYGFAARALLEAICQDDTRRFSSVHGRFSAPVFPGDELTVKVWEAEGGASFRVERSDGTTVLDHGRFVASPSDPYWSNHSLTGGGQR